MDKEKYERWLKENSTIVYRVCMYVTEDEELSKEILKDVFVDCYFEMVKQKEVVYKTEQELCYLALKKIREHVKAKKRKKRGGIWSVASRKNKGDLPKA